MFLTLEGIEGSGKSTLARSLHERLSLAGSDVLLTREPGGTPVGDSVRELLLRSRLDVSPLTEAFLMNAARAELVSEKIKPALSQGRIVLSRSLCRFDAWLTRGTAVAWTCRCCACSASTATGGLDPDITLLLDLPVECLRERLADRAGIEDRFEIQDMTFHERVRHGYLELAKGGGRWHVFDATLAPDRLLDAAWDVVQSHVAA